MGEIIEAFKPKCPVEGWVQCINCIYHKKMESYDMCNFDYHPINAQFPRICIHYVQKNPTPTVDSFIKANAEILAIAEMERIIWWQRPTECTKDLLKNSLAKCRK